MTNKRDTPQEILQAIAWTCDNPMARIRHRWRVLYPQIQFQHAALKDALIADFGLSAESIDGMELVQVAELMDGELSTSEPPTTDPKKQPGRPKETERNQQWLKEITETKESTAVFAKRKGYKADTMGAALKQAKLENEQLK